MGDKMINKTCKDEDFFKVFKELKHEQSLDLPNSNKLEMYYTKIMNNKFEYTALIDLLSSNITNYVFHIYIIFYIFYHFLYIFLMIPFLGL